MEDFDKVFPDLLQKITHSGEKKLDGNKIKKIDQLISLSSKHCKSSYQQIMRHLEKKHAEVRFSTLLICDYLVRNNKMFRKLLIGEDMTKFMELTLGTNKANPLPPPKTVAKELNSKALSVIFNWHTDFGKTFMELANAYFFLKDCMKVDFGSLERQRSAARVKAEMEEKRAIAKREEHLNKALKEFKDFSEEAQRLCTELESCISLLLPTPEDFFLPLESDTTASSSSDPSLREHGIVSAGTSIPIQLNTTVPKIVINEDNQPIVESARDLHSQLTKNHLKRVESWVGIFTNQPDHVVKHQMCKALLEQYKKCLAQYNELGLKSKKRLMSDSSDEDDFEEVGLKEGYEEKVKDELLASIIASKAEKAKQLEERKKNKLLEKPEAKEKNKNIVVQAPKEKLPTSIEEWEKRTICLPPVIVGNRPDSQVWIGPSVEDSEEIKVPEIESCPVEITSSFEPVKWACRAPLQNGTLCPRKDRVKCPFHGKVVPRDEAGNFVREEDAKAEQLRKERHMVEHPDWQDPKLLAEIKKATGIDLEMPKKGKRKKRAPEFPGLTDIKMKKDSPRKRLARKVLSKSDLRQIKSKLDIDPEDATEKEFYLSDESDS